MHVRSWRARVQVGRRIQLSDAPSVTRVRQIYRGIQDPRSAERLSLGRLPTSEADWLPQTFASEMARIATSYFQHVVFKDPSWEPSRLNLDAAVARACTVDDGPYPQVATYTGQGSTDEAGSFVCKTPTSTR